MNGSVPFATSGGAPVRLLTFTTLFPDRERPNHGVFVENRLRHLIATGEAESTVLAPTPWFPFTGARFGQWGRLARVPLRERRHGLTIHHPRYPVIPRFGMAAAPVLLYLASLHAIRRLISEGLRFDAIDAHYMYPDGVAAVWLGRSLGKPVAITARGSDITELPEHVVPRRMISRALRKADALIGVSAALCRRMIELGADPARVTTLRNGVDIALFAPGDRATARAELNLSGPTLISVGLLIERKGHHRSIAAMSELPGYRLLIVGEGPEQGRLEALIGRLGVGDRVHLLGPKPHTELPALYGAADAMLLSSSREGWANVLLESMACGTPVVASNIPGNPEVVQAPEAGLIVEQNTPSGIAAGVRRLFQALPDRQATRAYAERFGWAETSAGQLAIFRRICGAQSERDGRHHSGITPPGDGPLRG